LPFLRHFSFTVHALGRHTVDKGLFPSITSFLRGRHQLQTLQLIVDTTPTSLYASNIGGVISASNLEAVGYDASIWGLLPSLGGLKAVRMTCPRDLAPGLAGWLIPRSVTALGIEIGVQRLNTGLDDVLGSTSGISSNLATFLGVGDQIFILFNFLTITQTSGNGLATQTGSSPRPEICLPQPRFRKDCPQYCRTRFPNGQSHSSWKLVLDCIKKATGWTFVFTSQ